jgi:predicted metal-dependent enzyme (double-stranded beta helix superfamily)
MTMKSAQPNESPREQRKALLEDKRASSCTVDSIVGFPIPTSFEEYLMLTDEQKFRLYELTKKPTYTFTVKSLV